MSKGSKFFSVMVIGENPEELMEKYNRSLKVKPYIKYKYLDAEKLKNNASRMLNDITTNPKKFMLNEFQCDYFKERLKSINAMTPFEYYSTITQGMYYDENGNALSEENPNGKWDKYNLGKNYSYPLILLNGEERYQAVNKDIDWASMHMNHNYTNLFEIIWALVIDDDDPSNDEEKKIKEEWSNRKNYLSKFKNVDEFVAHNCAYWNYAFLDKDGWRDVDDDGNEIKWVGEFYDKFISNLQDDDLVTIYEYSYS